MILLTAVQLSVSAYLLVNRPPDLVFSEDSQIRLRAQVDIRAGEEITIQYISHLFSNILRREEIVSNWMFQCSCARCEDPSELGTHLGTILCSGCDGGHLLPEDNSYQCQVWRCKVTTTHNSHSESRSRDLELLCTLSI